MSEIRASRIGNEYDPAKNDPTLVMRDVKPYVDAQVLKFLRDIEGLGLCGTTNSIAKWAGGRATELLKLFPSAPDGVGPILASTDAHGVLRPFAKLERRKDWVVRGHLRGFEDVVILGVDHV